MKAQWLTTIPVKMCKNEEKLLERWDQAYWM